MLTTQLRELGADGLVKRQIFATVPPTVDYSLTEFTLTTLRMLNYMKK